MHLLLGCDIFWVWNPKTRWFANVSAHWFSPNSNFCLFRAMQCSLLCFLEFCSNFVDTCFRGQPMTRREFQTQIFRVFTLLFSSPGPYPQILPALATPNNDVYLLASKNHFSLLGLYFSALSFGDTLNESQGEHRVHLVFSPSLKVGALLLLLFSACRVVFMF